MNTTLPHPWPQTALEAEALQLRLSQQVEQQDRLPEIRTVAGLDVAYGTASDELVAAAVLLDARTLKVLERATIRDQARFPYVPGLFSFRELPPLLRALAALKTTPDLLICDGQGRAHPRRFGLACHLGLVLDLPSIGCGKTRLVGQESEPAPQRGSWTPLLDGPEQEVIGATLRTQTGVRPIYVSVGHRVSLETACAWILRLSPRYRLPETTRAADQLVRRLAQPQEQSA